MPSSTKAKSVASGFIFFHPVSSVSDHVPCSVVEMCQHSNILTNTDGKGTGFGNKISIQTVDLVNAFKHLGHAYNIQEGDPVSTYDKCFEISRLADQ